MLVILATVLIAFSFVSMTSVAGPVRENYCVRQMNKVQELITQYVESKTWKNFEAKYTADLGPIKVAQLNELVSDMLLEEGVPLNDPMFEPLVAFIVGLFVIMSCFIGKNLFTASLAFAASSIIVFPTVLLVDGALAFLIAVPLAVMSVLTLLYNFIDVDAFLKFTGLFGLVFLIVFIVPLISVAILGALIVAFPTMAFPWIITDLIDIYTEAYYIIRQMI